jgi:hypothetical protein
MADYTATPNNEIFSRGEPVARPYGDFHGKACSYQEVLFKMQLGIQQAPGVDVPGKSEAYFELCRPDFAPKCFI